MEKSKTPLWKRSILQHLNLGDIQDDLWRISENGDCYGYDGGQEGYYQEYKQNFDELADAAGNLLEAINEWQDSLNVSDEHAWDDMAVTLLGDCVGVYGFDDIEEDYFRMLGDCEDYDTRLAQQEATKRITRLTKQQMVDNFQKVLQVIISYADIKAAHDCLVSIVEELDERGALLSKKNDTINQLYEDLTGKDGRDFDRLIADIPQRMWLE